MNLIQFDGRTVAVIAPEDLEAQEAEIVFLRAEVERLSRALGEAMHRIEDMLEDDDGQAFKEARKFLLRVKGER